MQNITKNKTQTTAFDYQTIERTAPAMEPARQFYFIDRLRELVEEKKQHGYEAACLVNVIGCQMSAKDGEKLSGILREAGFREAPDEDHADVILFTTCTVRENANDRLYGRIGRLKHQYERRPGMVIGITGCMMQEAEEAETIRRHYPYVHLVFGTHNVYRLAELLYRTLITDSRTYEILPDTDRIVENLPSVRKYPFKASVNISFGCNNFCTYCIVPYVRGREKSRNAEDILTECRRLVSEGVQEIMLLGQNVNSWGNDLRKKAEKEGAEADGGAKIMDFPTLLSAVAEIPGLRRVRFMTSHPKDLSDALIEVIRTHPNIARHIHLPMQSGSTEILRRMNRRYTKEQYLSLVQRIRTALPDVSLTTDIIVGFPGEMEEDFADTIRVVEACRFDSAFTFIYSRRRGTPAAEMEQVPEEVVKPRFARLLQVVRECSAGNADRNVGKVMEVLVEEIEDAGSGAEEGEAMLTGRLSDNLLVHFRGPVSLLGSMTMVRLDRAMGFYYFGSLPE